MQRLERRRERTVGGGHFVLRQELSARISARQRNDSVNINFNKKFYPKKRNIGVKRPWTAFPVPMLLTLIM